MRKLAAASTAVTEHSRTILAAEKAIDTMMYELFELNAAPIALIEGFNCGLKPFKTLVKSPQINLTLLMQA